MRIMLFNSFQFLIFFPITGLVYYIIPSKLRHIWLLAASYYFYMCWNASYALLLLFSTAVTWLSGLGLWKLSVMDLHEKRRVFLRKLCVVTSFTLNLSLLFFYKYFFFVLDNVNAVFEAFHLKIYEPSFDILLPVGISFYTFQALSYTMDVYRQQVEVERNFVKYALFVSFFPQLVAGPIERSKNLLIQIEKLDRIKLWNYERIRDGILLMSWGFFQKIVIADRIAIVVNKVFDNYHSYGCVELVSAAVLFSFQIYCDFGGYSNIAKGTAQVMGVHLMDNFKQPYLAVNIKDFWRRWHISLTTWFTDYLYIPLGGNRKGKLKQARNIMIVYLCSGLWHGAAWTYVVWGGLHGCTQVIYNTVGSLKSKLNTEIGILGRMLRTGMTFAAVTIFWIFFRADTIGQAFGYFGQMLRYRRLQNFEAMGLGRADWIVLFIALMILILVDLLHEKGIRIRKKLYEKNLFVRGAVYLGIVWAILLFGIYGYQYDASQFIYFQF